jgi:hypothetical protein
MRHSSHVRLVGRRTDRPQSILLRDEEGRYFLRAACGSRPVRVTNRDAEAIMRQYGYNAVIDGDWHPPSIASNLGCLLPDASESLDATNAT